MRSVAPDQIFDALCQATAMDVMTAGRLTRQQKLDSDTAAQGILYNKTPCLDLQTAADGSLQSSLVIRTGATLNASHRVAEWRMSHQR